MKQKFIHLTEAGHRMFEPKEQKDRRTALDIFVARLPQLDVKWPEELQERWWNLFARLAAPATVSLSDQTELAPRRAK